MIKDLTIDKFTIKAVQESDSESIIEILNEPRNYFPISSSSPLPTNHLYGIWKQDEMIGVILIRPNNDSAYEIAWGLKDDYRFKGIASKIIPVVVEEILKEHKDCIIACHIGDQNTLTMAQRLNFKYISKDGDRYIYCLSKNE